MGMLNNKYFITKFMWVLIIKVLTVKSLTPISHLLQIDVSIEIQIMSTNYCIDLTGYVLIFYKTYNILALSNFKYIFKTY